MALPRPELLNFDGNPKDYHQFLHNFEANIETSIKCERLRLTYLIQQCSGKARESIQDCVVLPAKRGYLKAKEILRDRFGQPHLIARSYIRSLTEGQPVKGSTQLSDLAVKMTRCSLVLSQLSYNSDMNNSQNLLKIVRRLPMHLRGKWVDEADKILAKGREPIFSDLAKFIDSRARAANNMYGEDMNNVVEKKGVKNDKKFSSYKATTLATSENTGAAIRDSSKGSCKVCKGDHTVGHCKIFKDTDRNLRWSILKKCGLCANCLLSGHLARDCSKKPACATCNRKHHPLLHINFEKTKEATCSSNNNETTMRHSETKDVTCSATAVSHHVCLRIVPVRVEGKQGPIETFALLDSGSDVSLFEEDLLNKISAKTKEKTFNITTVNSNKTIVGKEASMSISSLDGKQSVRLENAWSVPSLPINAESIPNADELKEWSHLKDITFPSIKTDKYKYWLEVMYQKHTGNLKKGEEMRKSLML